MNFIYNLYTIEPLIYGNTIYTILGIKCKHAYPCGFILDARNIETGERYWYKHFDSKMHGRYEMPMKLFINSDNKLELIGLLSKLKISGDNYFGDDKFTTMTRRVFNLYTGDLIHEHFKLNQNSATNLHYYNTSNTDFFIMKNGIRFLTYYYSNNGKIIETLLIDSLGVGDKNKFFKYNRIQDFNNIVQVNDSILLGIAGPNIYTDSVTFYFFDKDFNHRKIDADPASSYARRFGNIKLFDDRIVLNAYAGDAFNENYEYYIYDLNGKLINKALLDVERRFSINHKPILVQDDKLYLATLPFTDFFYYYNSIDILRSNEKGTFDIVFRIFYKDLTRYSAVVYSLQHNQDFIWLISELAFEPDKPLYTDSNSGAYVYERIKAKDIGIDIRVDTKEELIEKDFSASIYPNPVNDILEMSFKENFSGTITVINQLGQVERNLEINKSNFVGIDVSFLSSGLHFVLLTTNEGRKLSRTFVKI
jgi:hypothetical protein